jgi:hypothetical protein
MLQTVPMVSAQRAMDLADRFPRPLELHAALHPRGGSRGGDRLQLNEAFQKKAEEMIQTANVNKKVANKLYKIFTSLNPDEDVTS